MKANLLLSTLLILTTLFVSSTTIALSESIISQGNIEPTEEWQEHTTIDNVKIEFKRKRCIPTSFPILIQSLITEN